MGKQVISTGSSANDGTGDTLRSAGTKINANFTELYNRQERITVTRTTGVNVGDSDDVFMTFTGLGKHYVLNEIKTNRKAYVRIYSDSDAANQDTVRKQMGDSSYPGLIYQSLHQADSAFKITPGVMGWTDSSDAFGNVRVVCRNLSGAPNIMSVRIKVLRLET